jgi:hypothetical protein
MATQQPRNDLHTPCIAKLLGGASVGALHVSSDFGGLAPPGINHMPCMFVTGVSGGFTYKDANGTTITHNINNNSVYLFTVAELTGVAPAGMLFFWQPEP